MSDPRKNTAPSWGQPPLSLIDVLEHAPANAKPAVASTVAGTVAGTAAPSGTAASAAPTPLGVPTWPSGLDAELTGGYSLGNDPELLAEQQFEQWLRQAPFPVHSVEPGLIVALRRIAVRAMLAQHTAAPSAPPAAQVREPAPALTPAQDAPRLPADLTLESSSPIPSAEPSFTPLIDNVPRVRVHPSRLDVSPEPQAASPALRGTSPATSAAPAALEATVAPASADPSSAASSPVAPLSAGVPSVAPRVRLMGEVASAPLALEDTPDLRRVCELTQVDDRLEHEEWERRVRHWLGRNCQLPHDECERRVDAAVNILTIQRGMRMPGMEPLLRREYRALGHQPYLEAVMGITHDDVMDLLELPQVPDWIPRITALSSMANHLQVLVNRATQGQRPAALSDEARQALELTSQVQQMCSAPRGYSAALRARKALERAGHPDSAETLRKISQLHANDLNLAARGAGKLPSQDVASLTRIEKYLRAEFAPGTAPEGASTAPAQGAAPAAAPQAQTGVEARPATPAPSAPPTASTPTITAPSTVPLERSRPELIQSLRTLDLTPTGLSAPDPLLPIRPAREGASVKNGARSELGPRVNAGAQERGAAPLQSAPAQAKPAGAKVDSPRAEIKAEPIKAEPVKAEPIKAEPSQTPKAPTGETPAPARPSQSSGQSLAAAQKSAPNGAQKDAARPSAPAPTPEDTARALEQVAQMRERARKAVEPMLALRSAEEISEALTMLGLHYTPAQVREAERGEHDATERALRELQAAAELITEEWRAEDERLRRERELEEGEAALLRPAAPAEQTGAYLRNGRRVTDHKDQRQFLEELMEGHDSLPLVDFTRPLGISKHAALKLINNHKRFYVTTHDERIHRD